MMNNVNNSTPSFGSTRFPATDINFKKSLQKLNEYFEVKGFGNNKTSQEIADYIDFDKAGYVLEGDEIRVVGKDGGPGGADTFIGRIMKEIIPEAKYVDDVKPVKVDGPVIDLNI